MAVPAVQIVSLGGPHDPSEPQVLGQAAEGMPPIVLVGPSLGTSATNLWSQVARVVADQSRVLGWDLPGHGGAPAAESKYTIQELAQGVIQGLDTVLDAEGVSKTERSFVYAGCSVGGAVGQQLLLDFPDRVSGAVLTATAQKIGTRESWMERAELVARAGTPTMIAGSAQRWFAEGFIARDAASGAGVAPSLLHDLQDADHHGYAQVCEALADFDVHGRLGNVQVPVVAIAGGEDLATTPQQVRELAEAVPGARYLEYDAVAHLPPAEAPERVAEQVRAILGEVAAAGGDRDSSDQGATA